MGQFVPKQRQTGAGAVREERGQEPVANGTIWSYFKKVLNFPCLVATFKIGKHRSAPASVLPVFAQNDGAPKLLKRQRILKKVQSSSLYPQKGSVNLLT